ncbi:hypothetical protein ACO0QE_001811 [Hanseniaspora vineae]
MSDLLPLATFNLKVSPYAPTPAIDLLTPVTVRLTLAAVDPEAVDDEDKPSTLRVIKRNPNFIDEDDEIDQILGDYDEDADKDEDDEDDEDDEFDEHVLLTLYPKGQCQQSLDITIAPEEELVFVVTGSYPIHLTGNFVKHPFDSAMDDDEDEDSEDEDSEYDSEEDELDVDVEGDDDEEEDSYYQDALEELENASDIEGRIEELIEQDDKDSKKRKQIEEVKEEEEEKKKKRKKLKSALKEDKEPVSKKQKKNEKSVKFKKDLEEGPTNSKKEEPAKKEVAKKEEPAKKEATKKETASKKPEVKTQVLEGGVIIEDRTVGNGKKCKRGNKVGMRYVGKLKKNGKVFDKNTKGKPFVFNLGRGEVIKGWDIGVAGMAVGGERRIIIPSAYAYGSQALPGIPKNSDMIFDVKLVSMK